MKQLKYVGRDPNRLVMLLLALWTILNLVQAAFTGLANDELYYWHISHGLAFGYFDHPPLFALFTRLGMSIGGDGELWIRLGTVLVQPLYLYLLWMLVRTPRSTMNSAFTFVMVAFSMPLLQLFGFIVTPDAPLMLFVALLLWSYKRYCEVPVTGNWIQGGWNSLAVAAACVGVSMAGLAYAKYHGALVVILIVLSNLKLLKRGSFWAACGLAVVLILPHLWWQWQHDWVSFSYHLSGRNDLFSWGPVGEYILNLLLIFNPALVIFFAGYMFKSKRIDPLERALKFIAYGFVLFFGFSTLKGQVQAQWLIPVVFTAIYFLCRGAEGKAVATRYMQRVGVVMLVLVGGVRIFVMAYNGDRIDLDILINEKYIKQLHEDIGGLPLIPDSYYATAAKYIYYTGTESYAAPSIYLRSSQFEFEDGDTDLYGRRVAIVISPKVLDSLTLDQMKERYLWSKPTPTGSEVIYDTVGFYIPTRKVSITPQEPLLTKMMAGQRVPLTVIVHNPYEFDIPLAGIQLLAQLRYQRLTYYDIEMEIPSVVRTLPAGQSVRFKSSFTIPADVPTQKYKLGFTLQRYPFSSWYNSGRVEVQVVNAAQNRGR